MKKLYALLVFFAVTAVSLSAQRTISGVLVDDDGLAIIGANIILKNTTIGTISEFDGTFSLDVPAGSETIVFSYTGYNTIEMPIGASNTMNVTMTLNSRLIDEIVVVGYSDGTRLGKVASVSTISSESIENKPTPNVVSSIQGQIPGFLTSANSGQPGSSQEVRIRGVGSITAGRNPLYVIDGVIVQTGSISQLDASSNSSTCFMISLISTSSGGIFKLFAIAVRMERTPSN